jgi:hypothetical protein
MFFMFYFFPDISFIMHCDSVEYVFLMKILSISWIIAYFERIVDSVDKSFHTVLSIFVVETVLEGLAFFCWNDDCIFNVFWFSVQSLFIFPPDLYMIFSYFLGDFYADEQIISWFESAFRLFCYSLLMLFHLILSIDKGLANNLKGFHCTFGIITLLFGLRRIGSNFSFIDFPTWLNLLCN